MGAEIAGDAEMSPAVRAVAGEVDIEHDLALQREGFAVREPERRVRWKDQDPAVVITEAEFAGRTEHALRVDAEDRAGLDHPTIGHLGARCGERDDIAGRHVERPAPDVALRAVAGVDPHSVDLGGIGVAFGTEHFRGDHAIDGGSDVADLLDLDTESCHRRGDRHGVVADGRDVVEPGENDLHACLASRLRTA